MYLTIDTGFKFYNYKKYPRIFSFHSYWKAYNWLGRKKLHTTIRLQQSAPKISDRNCPHMFCKISYEIRKKDAMKKENLIALEERIKKVSLIEDLLERDIVNIVH